MKISYLGISGVAGSGKDLFFSLFKEEMKNRSTDVKRYALADSLKKEVADFTKEAYGIDAFNCSGKDKELIRPFLVFHGTLKRNQTKGRHWIDILQSVFDSRGKDETPDISCITDIRYAKYENDEVSWLKNDLRGVLIHINQYSKPQNLSNDKVFLCGANEEERSQDPILKEAADYNLEWEKKSGSSEEIEQYTRNEVIKFIEWLSSFNEKR